MNVGSFLHASKTATWRPTRKLISELATVRQQVASRPCDGDMRCGHKANDGEVCTHAIGSDLRTSHIPNTIAHYKK